MDIVYAFLMIVSLVDMVFGYCTLSDLNICMDQFFMEAGVDQNTIAKLGTIDYINAPILKRRCRAYDNLEKCLSPHKSRCDITMKRLYESLENVYSYICYQSFEDHLKNSKCLQSPSAAHFIHRCGVIYESDTKLLGFTAQSAAELKTQTCKLTKEALSCIKDVAKSKCGGEAANHINTVNLKMLQPIAEDIHCDLEKHFPTWAIVLMVLSGTGLATACLVCYCKTRRRREHYYSPEAV